MSVFEHEVYSGIPLFCADSIQSAISFLASSRLCASMMVGSLSIVGVSILPYAEIEQYYFMNNCYVCIYK